MATDSWDPQKYGQFESQRSQPFYELLALIEARDPDLVVDLGCGTGSLTRKLHETLRARQTVGVDSSPAMLARANEFQGEGLEFTLGDISDLTRVRAALPSTSPPSGSRPDDAPHVDVVFSNAALQWIPDHPRVIARWSELLGESGELAIQVPSNFDHPSHQIIAELADEEPFHSAGEGPLPRDPVQSVLK
ncbi:MAG: methyltransferase domain-containing protein, partial [Microthrixaceae bacterium]